LWWDSPFFFHSITRWQKMYTPAQFDVSQGDKKDTKGIPAGEETA
jgi:hypothetical protein